MTKVLDLKAEPETLRSKIARKSEAIVDYGVPLDYRRADLPPKANAVADVAHSYGGNGFIRDFSPSSPSAA